MPKMRTPDGTELFYRDWGAGRPVLLVHGMLMSSHMWQHQMLHLVEHGYRAVAYDRGELAVYRNASHMLHLSHRQQLNTDRLAFARS